MKHNYILGLSIALLASTASAAQEKPWSFDAELGLISTSGNTDSSSIKGKIDAKQNLDNWRNQYVFETLYNQNEILSGDAAGQKETTAQRWFTSIQSDYKLDDKHQGLFVYASYEDDRFSGFDYQGTFAIGYSDRWFENAKSHFDYSVGPGVSFVKFEDTDLVEGESEETAILRLSASYLYQISENAKFTQTFSSDVAFESDRNTKSKAESAITANLNSSFALKASLSINHNSEVPAERESTDTQTALTLVYSY